MREREKRRAEKDIRGERKSETEREREKTKLLILKKAPMWISGVYQKS